jgi:effector-binding domain-containing protein
MHAVSEVFESGFVTKWTLITSAGCILSLPIAFIASHFTSGDAMAAFHHGAVVGFAQWLLLRKRFAVSGWWVAACAVGLGVPFFAGAIVYHVGLLPHVARGIFFACPAWEVDPTTIGVKDIAQETVVKFVHRGPYSEMFKSIYAMEDVVLNAGLIQVGAPWGTYLNGPDEVAPKDLRTEIAIRVSKVMEGEPKLPSGYVFTRKPAMRVAYAYHRGDHSGEGEAHQRLQASLAQQGLQPAGPPRVVWFHDPKVTITENLVTEVQIPIFSTK